MAVAFTMTLPLSAEVVYGVFLRLLGLMFAFAHAQLIPQILAIGGRRGQQSMQMRLRRFDIDFAFPHNYLAFPSLLMPLRRLPPASFDRALQLGLAVGCAAGLLSAAALPLGALSSRVWLAVTWAVYLSYANIARGLNFPWDYLLLEMGFLSLLLPAVVPGSLALARAPTALSSLSLRWLLFRLMFGFGKMKFSGSTPLTDLSYMHGFLINQPLPTVFGWLLHQLPLPAHWLALALFFVSEIAVPFGFVLATGALRRLCAVATLALQATIGASGSYGFFNLLSALLAVVALDGDAALWGVTWAEVRAAPVVSAVQLLLLLLSLLFLLFNSWATMSFPFWPSINLPRTAIGGFVRALAHLHVLHAYGVFFPHSSPPIRLVAVIEATDDAAVERSVDAGEPGQPEAQWERYEYRFMTTRTRRMPPFMAPLHWRLDQAVIYDSLGLTADTLLCSLTSGNCYDFEGEHATPLDRVAQSLLLDVQDTDTGEASAARPGPMEAQFRHNPFPSSSRPARALRLQLYHYEATKWTALWSTGRYWTAKDGGAQGIGGVWTRRKLRRALSMSYGKAQLPDGFRPMHEPSMWHPDHYLWQTRSVMYQRLTALHGQGTDLGAAICAFDDEGRYAGAGNGLAALWWRRFWDEFMPEVRPLHGRAVSTTSCALRLGKGKASGDDGCPCDCLSCALWSEWRRQRCADAEGRGPVLDWSAELTALRERLTAGAAPRFSAVDWFHFSLIAHRLVLLLTHRVLSEPGLYPTAVQTPLSGMSAADEAALLAAADRARSADERCPRKCHGGSTSPCTFHLAGERARGERVTQRCPAPTVELNVGILPDTSSSSPEQPSLSLPSFYHLHLLLQHALLSCASPPQFSALLASPARLLPLRASLSLSTGLLLPGLWLRDLLAYHAVKSRLSLMMSFPEARTTGGPMPGFMHIYLHFLPWQFSAEEGEDARPRSVRRPESWSGCWRVDSSNMKSILV